MGRAAKVAREVRWYVGALMGDTHYQRYVEHRRRSHPDEPVLSERDYWKMSYDLAVEHTAQSKLERDRALTTWGGAAAEHIRLMGEIARLERALRDIGACTNDPQITSRVREELEANPGL